MITKIPLARNISSQFFKARMRAYASLDKMLFQIKKLCRAEFFSKVTKLTKIEKIYKFYDYYKDYKKDKKLKINL